MSRRDEVWRLNQLSAEELTARAQGKLLVLNDSKALHAHLAKSIADVLREKPNAVLILPCGPVAHYPLLRDLITRNRISLRKARLLFIAEYADPAGSVLPVFHPLSFRGAITSLWEQMDPVLRPVEENIIFPDQHNLEEIPTLIEKAGGIDACFAGVGIDGHIGFNEPEPGVRDSTCRLARLNDFTVATQSLRSNVGGDIENFPRSAYTLGMEQCLSARRIRIYCHSEEGTDWARTILRLAVLGQAGDDYPVTWIRWHADWQVITDRNSAEPPQNVL